MINCKLINFDCAQELVSVCRRYEEDIDVICGRYIIDGKSTLGVASLVGSHVSIEINTEDGSVKEKFKKEMEKALNESRNYQ